MDAMARRATACGVAVVRVLTDRTSATAPPGTWVTLVDAEGVLHRRFGVTGPTAVLIRPDGHIAHIAGARGTDGLLAALRPMVPGGAAVCVGSAAPAPTRENLLSSG